MFMFDSSSEIPEYNYDIETAIASIKNGYLLTITPDSDWLNSDDRVYPVMIDPEFMPTITTLTDSYITEKDSNSCIDDGLMLKMGGAIGDRYESFLSFNTSDIFTTADEILDATCTMFFVADTTQENYPTIAVRLLQESVSEPTWNTANYSKIDSVNYEEYPTSIHFALYQDLDITGLVQTWQNYVKTNGVVGSPNYGFKLLSSIPTGDYSCISAYSSRYLWPPSFKITYRTQTPYKLYYSPYKYNNKETVANFQNRMNCYSYALQMYYRGTGSYAIYPGEIGIGQQISSDNYNAITYEQLMEYYDSFVFPIESRIDELTDYKDVYSSQIYSYVANDSEFAQLMNNYLDFFENQMKRDAEIIDFEISKYDNSSVLSTSDVFTPPSNYNESNERVIAMIAYYLYTGRFNGSLTMHYYMRHGNGTCTMHGGNCSLWSQKMGLGTVSNLDSLDTILCDQTIYDCAYNIGSSNVAYNANLVNFYSITKDTNVYNSWYGNGHYDESTGTPYLSLT